MTTPAALRRKLLWLIGGRAGVITLLLGVPLGVAAWLGYSDKQRNKQGDRDELRLRPDTSFLLRQPHGVRHA